MTFMRMPLFCWTSLCTAILMIFAMPPLTVATLLLAADRYLGMHFFTDDGGGNMMNYVNLFWLFGHPEVYILVLPAFGVYSEVISAFSSKELYGYTSLVIATMAIAVLSFTVWLHHFFTMGQSANVNAAFGIATMTIGVPTGVKIYDWIWTMFRGEVRFTPPMVLSIAFMMTFVLGGFTGIILATPPLDYMVHNTLFLVAHFHNMLIPGTLYGMLAGYMYWFPKAFGFRLNERWGWISAGCWIAGFYLAFFPLYVLGAAGMARRTQEVFDPAFRPWLLRRPVRRLPAARRAADAVRPALRVHPRPRTPTRCRWATRGTRAGWNGRSRRRRRSGTSPPSRMSATATPSTGASATAAPTARPTTTATSSCRRRRACGVIIGVAAGLCGFGLVWRIWWMAALFGLLVVATVIARSFMRDVTARSRPPRSRRWTGAGWPRRTRPAGAARAGDDAAQRGGRLPARMDERRPAAPPSPG